MSGKDSPMLMSWKNEKANFLAAKQVDEEERLAKKLKPLSEREAKLTAGDRKTQIGRVLKVREN